jgi:UDP-N-acetylmuramate--alanine ligase
VTSNMLFKDITSVVKLRCTKKDLLQNLESMNIEVLATVGAGDIDTMVKPIKEMLKGKLK